MTMLRLINRRKKTCIITKGSFDVNYWLDILIYTSYKVINGRTVNETVYAKTN